MISRHKKRLRYDVAVEALNSLATVIKEEKAYVSRDTATALAFELKLGMLNINLKTTDVTSLMPKLYLTEILIHTFKTEELSDFLYSYFNGKSEERSRLLKILYKKTMKFY
jgi:hypothetical protein